MGKIYKTLILNNEISLTVLDTTDVVNKAIEIHNLSPVCSAALGRSMTAVAFMSSTLKNKDDKVTVTISGNGYGGQIVVLGNSNLEIRGSIDNVNLDLPLRSDGKLNVGMCVGNEGRITVVKDIGLKEPYVGSCKLVSGEIAEDFATYYAYSEQQPTAIALGVKIGTDCKCIGAGGVVLQPLPNASEESLQQAEKIISEFKDISDKIYKMGIDGVCQKYFGEYSFNKYETNYKCKCSRDYINKVLISVGSNDLYREIEENGKIEVCCQFCNSKYLYLKKDIDELFINGKNN